MSITDELREWWVRKFPVMDREMHKDFTAIADRIDAEHESACAEAYGNGVESVALPDMTAYVKLPLDADGEVIHVGDELDVGFVARIVITDDEWPSYLYAYKETPHILTQHFCEEVSHYHAPTVEDVLREMLEQAVGYSDAHTTVALNAIAEYSAKLRLAKGEDA